MLLAKPNPQNYYSVTVALYRPNLLIELKRFLFISFSLCSCLLSLLFSYSLFFVFPFFLFSCFLVVSFCLFCCPAPFSPCQDQSRLCTALWAKRKGVSALPLLFSYFYVGAMSFLYAHVAVDASASCCLYIIMWGAEKFV